MTIKYYKSPFHVTHNDDIADDMANKVDLTIMVSRLIKEIKWTQIEAAKAFNFTNLNNY
jgi:hypothetical protein